MLPSDGRFGCGPSKVRSEEVEAVARAARAAGGLRGAGAQLAQYCLQRQERVASVGSHWIALCRPAEVDPIKAVRAAGRWVLAVVDVAIALENSRVTQPFNSPALAVVF